jgi:hypothetical protein
MAANQATPMLTVVTVLKGGRHVIHQTDALPGNAGGVLIGATSNGTCARHGAR